MEKQWLFCGRAYCPYRFVPTVDRSTADKLLLRLCNGRNTGCRISDRTFYLYYQIIGTIYGCVDWSQLVWRAVLTVVLPSIHRKSIFATVTELAKPVRHPEVLYLVVKVSIAAVIYSLRYNVTLFWVYEDWKQMFFCISWLWELRISCGWINLYDYSIVCLRRLEHYFRVRCDHLYSHLRLNILLTNIVSLIVEKVILMLNAINWKKFLARNLMRLFNLHWWETKSIWDWDSRKFQIFRNSDSISHGWTDTSQGCFHHNTRCCCERYMDLKVSANNDEIFSFLYGNIYMERSCW